MMPEELDAFLRLCALPGLGQKKLRAALGLHRDPRRALQAFQAHMTPAQRRALQSARLDGWVNTAAASIASLGIRILRFDDAEFPSYFEHLENPPAVLFLRGDAALLSESSLAVVGTRAASQYGIANAARLSARAARAGVTIVSGLAVGVDAAAHTAALQAGAKTIAVLGCGVDVVYPAENAELYRAIASRGLLVSEFMPGTPPIGHHFVQRNRIIAAIARSVLVIEAGARSGALSTARQALDLGRDVMAVPGPIDLPNHVGSNTLLRDGAHIVCGEEDLLFYLGLLDAPGMPNVPELCPPEDPESARLWQLLDTVQAAHVDEIAERAGAPAPVVLRDLLALELNGHVRQRAGMRFVRC